MNKFFIAAVLSILFVSIKCNCAFAYEFGYRWCDFKFTYPKEPLYVLPEKAGLPSIVEFDEGKYQVTVACEMNNTHIIPNEIQMCESRREAALKNERITDCTYRRDEKTASTLTLSEVPYQTGGNFLNIEATYISHRNKFVVSLSDFGLTEDEQFRVWQDIVRKIEWVGNPALDSASSAPLR